MSVPVAGAAVQKAVNWSDGLCAVLIAIASGMRIQQWLQGRSLWLDEAYLAVNLAERGFSELHLPLEYSQSAPWLFLCALKVMIALGGLGEVSLRTLPLVASVLSLVFFWRLVRRHVAAWVAPVGVLIFAFAHMPFLYAQELKQYSLDILLCTVVLWLADKVFDSRERPAGPVAGLAVVGTVGIFAMHSMPFLLAGVGGAMLWARWSGRLRVAYPVLFAMIVGWLVLFAVNYLVIIQPNYSDHVMKNYWAFSYPRLPWNEGGLKSWFHAISEFLYYLRLTGVFKLVFAALFAAGVVFAFRQRKDVLIAGLAAVVLYWMAGLAGRAPFFGRLLLFLFPILMLGCVVGLDFISKKIHPILVVFVTGLMLAPIARTFPLLVVPIETGENLREPVSALAAALEPGDRVYVAYWAQPGLRFYRRALGLDKLSGESVRFGGDYREFSSVTRREWAPRLVEPGISSTAQEVASLQPWNDRLWLLIAHFTPQQETMLVAELERKCGTPPQLYHRSRGSAVYCYPRSGSGRIEETQSTASPAQ